MSALVIDLKGRGGTYSPGEKIEGVVMWELDEPPREVEARLFWYTEGKGTRDVEVVEVVELQGGNVRGEEGFEFTAPMAPHGFSGRLISLVWAVEVVASPGDHTDRVDIVIAPEGVEIELYGHEVSAS